MKQLLKLSLCATLLMLCANIILAADKNITLKSPDAKTVANITIGELIKYSISQDSKVVLAPSPISMELSTGETFGIGSKIKSIKNKSVNETIEAYFYKSNEIKDEYNQTRIDFKDGWSLEFRAYNDGIAYRIISHKTGKYQVVNEQVEYNFINDAIATAPYVAREGNLEDQLSQSFENIYTILPISKLNKNRLMFLPLSVETPDKKRITITESDLRDYPGMYLTSQMGKNSLSGLFAPLRKEFIEHTGHNNLQIEVTSRHNYLAEVNGARSFPWRAAIITRDDLELANSDMSYKLAEPNVIGDVSWVKPGKVAWEWWNDWNLEGVDFETGVNNETYKYYIDFASENGIEYVILDEGWAVNKVYDLMQVVPEINLEELIKYGEERNVGIILWAGYYAFDRDMEEVCKHYSQMGVKGFKVDFMDSDDQESVHFNERVALMCAKYKLMADLHGTYKPASLHRTYPNIVNFEGVYGLEQMKWAPDTVDHVKYSVTMPYLRMISGPIDYTQGAMKNTVKGEYSPNYSKPMSQGTRCHQFAQYIVFLSPLNMLCDTPTNYEKEPVSTEFIASVPTVWDESKTIQGEMGEYIVTARRKGDTWYIGGLTNWDAREITLNIKDITGKSGPATIYKDGPNAHRNAVDFVKGEIDTKGNITIKMAPGGGFVVVI